MKNNSVLSKYDINRLSELLDNLDNKFKFHSISTDGTIKFYTNRGFLNFGMFKTTFNIDFIELITSEIIPMIVKKRVDDPSINNELMRKIMEVVAGKQYIKADMIKMLYSYFIDTRSPMYMIVLGKSIVQIDNRAIKSEFLPPEGVINDILGSPHINISPEHSLMIAETLAKICNKELI